MWPWACMGLTKKPSEDNLDERSFRCKSLDLGSRSSSSSALSMLTSLKSAFLLTLNQFLIYSRRPRVAVDHLVLVTSQDELPSCDLVVAMMAMVVGHPVVNFILSALRWWSKCGEGATSFIGCCPIIIGLQQLPPRSTMVQSGRWSTWIKSTPILDDCPEGQRERCFPCWISACSYVRP